MEWTYHVPVHVAMHGGTDEVVNHVMCTTHRGIKHHAWMFLVIDRDTFMFSLKNRVPYFFFNKASVHAP